MKRLLNVVNSLLFISFICFMVYMLINSYDTMSLSKISTVLCILPAIMVPYLLEKIKVYKMDETLLFFYYVFIILSLIMGSIFKFYYRIWWFDLFTHFISGIITSIVAFIILEKNELVNEKNKWFGFLFIILFAIGVATGWEYLEFFCDKLFDTDTQWVFQTGVDDTMTDMLIATLAGIISSIYYLYYLKKSK